MTPPDGCPEKDQCELGSLSALKQDHMKWHLSREVSITHLVTTVLALAAFVAWAMKQEARIVRLEEHSVAMLKADEEGIKDRKELRLEIREELKEIRRLVQGMQRK